ncbi:helix-turn-helix transcriptional regulator [Streptomyces sp. NPDC094147]|uniref:helix-turn-helix transcriptional regulator n=1 Tax=Streptomyces sp. NPDC094147 TaxID=3366057 RepID=UPI0037F74A0C
MTALAWEVVSQQHKGASMGPRLKLAERRKVLGYSQERLADALGVATSTVGRWERGEIEPRGYVRAKLARLLHVKLEELGVLLEPGTPTPKERSTAQERRAFLATYGAVDNYLGTGDLDEMIRREFLRLVTVTGTLATLPAAGDAVPVEPPSFASTSDDIAGYTAMNSHLWQIFALAKSKRTALPMVHSHARAIADSFADVRTERERQGLCSVAGDLFQLAGEVHFDDNRYTDAAQCYTLAASASREARNPDLLACALTRHAFVSIYDRNSRDAASLLAVAADAAKRGDTQLSTRHWVAAIQAEVFATLGDLNSCKRALDQAEEVHFLNGAIHNGGWLRFDGSRLAEERGTCYVALGRPDLAEQALSVALDQPLSLRRRASVLTDLAALGVQRRDIDQLVSYASQAIHLASQTKSGYVVRKLQGLQGHIQPLMSDGRVSNLSDQISAFEMTA